MDVCLANWGNIATTILAGAAIFAGIYAALNLRVLKKRNRYEILLSLVNQIADREERANRAIINEKFKEGTGAKEIDSWIEAGREVRINPFYESGMLKGDEIEVIEDGVTNKHIRTFKEVVDTMNAVEETIACFDKVGFFLLERDAKLKDEAPDWIWTMSNGMWKRLGNYVLYRQESGDTHWGKYFKKLADEASKRLPK